LKKQTFLKNAALLTITTFITRSLSVWFRVIISQKIGSEGVGLLSLIFSVYAFFATFATTGITLTVTRMVTDALALKQNGNAKFIVKRCLIIGILISSITGIVLFMNSSFIGNAYLKDERTILSLKILSVSLPFMATSACLRGYFFAKRQALKTASEQLLEQIIEMAVFLVLINLTGTVVSLGFGCCLLIIGTTAAEVLSFFYSMMLYYLDIRKTREKSEKISSFYKKATLIGIPVTLSACLRSGLSSIENVLIPSGLKKYGADSEKALSQYGQIIGMVMPVLGFPNVFLYCFSQLMIPEMSEAKISRHSKGIQYMAGRIFRFSLFFSLPVSGIFIFFGMQLGNLIYNSPDAGFYIQTLAPIIPFLYLDQVVDGMLKGLNEQMHYLMCNILDSIIRVSLAFLLLPLTGTKGVIIIIFISGILNSGLSISRLLKVAEVKVNWTNWFIKPIIGIVSIGFLTKYISFGSLMINTVLKITIFSVLYIIYMIICKSINKEELHWLKNLFVEHRISL